MKKYGLFSGLLLLTISTFSQSREDTYIYIPPVLAADPSQAQFFKDNFEMETTAAGYTLTDSSRLADYTLKLEVKPNMILYEDGSEEPAPPEEGLFLLQINLIRNEDDVEIVAFSFPFTEAEEMHQFNLYLLYEAMANVPLTKMVGIIEEDDRWRNKWLYIRASLDYMLTVYELVEPDHLYTTNDAEDIFALDNKVLPYVAATIGVEFQFFNWMSTELNFNMSFSDPIYQNTFIPALQILPKFPIKPKAFPHLMLEPYGVVSYPVSTSSAIKSFPKMGVGGGFQFGIKGGSSGAIVIDFTYIYFLSDVNVENPYRNGNHYQNPSEIKYHRWTAAIGLGYKVGFVDRPKKAGR